MTVVLPRKVLSDAVVSLIQGMRHMVVIVAQPLVSCCTTCEQTVGSALATKSIV